MSKLTQPRRISVHGIARNTYSKPVRISPHAVMLVPKGPTIYVRAPLPNAMSEFRKFIRTIKLHIVCSVEGTGEKKTTIVAVGLRGPDVRRRVQNTKLKIYRKKK